MTAQEIIERARDHHESFTPARHLEGLLRRHLETVELQFYRRMAQVAEGAVAKDQVFSATDITTALAGSALTLPAYVKLLSLLVAKNNRIYGVGLTQDERTNGSGAFSARTIGRNLYLVQPAAFQAQMPAEMAAALADASPFKDADALRLTYVPRPAALTAPTSTLTAPDEARDYFIGALVLFMVRRTKSGVMGTERTELATAGQSYMTDVDSAFIARAANETGWHVSLVGN